MELHTTILRTDEFGDEVELDVAIQVAATCISRGYRVTRTDPGDGPEYECVFEGAELDVKPLPHSDTLGVRQPNEKLTGIAPLTEAELGTLRTWFDANTDKVWQAANDNFDDGPDPDEARDRAWDERGWRGLEA
jgi:hypothetical protein